MVATDRASTQALAQEFAEMLQNEPTVRRLWYVADPDRFCPDELYFQFYMLRSEADEEADHRIFQAAMDFQERHEQKVSTSLIHFSDDSLDEYGLVEEVPTDGIELHLRGR